ncbi:MAG TPA: hypothetical protein VN999_00945 [Thermoanaerobaculia bacterium]|nr:hypothetical protein [Thermoanaerobaculia bacterium]
MDDEELSELRTRLEIEAANNADSFAAFSPARLLAEVTKRRLPFVRMMSDVSSLLGQIEASIRGNVRFVVLPDLGPELLLDFGPQLRGAIATTLDCKLLVNHDERIAATRALLLG